MTTLRWLVRFGYDGRGFWGWARQPGRRTVEGTILHGLARHARRNDATEVEADVASRTDRAVSARANALVVRSRLSGSSLLRQLNGIDPGIFFTAATPVEDAFRVRRAARRSYRYFEPAGNHDLDAWRQAASVLRGRIDARSFGRAIPSADPVWREVEDVRVDPEPGGLRIGVCAPSFVWGMVRKMVGALREHAAGRLPLDRLDAAARGRVRLTLPLAEPEGLVLWEVEYPVGWSVAWTGPNRHQIAQGVGQRTSLWVRERILDQLLPRSGPER